MKRIRTFTYQVLYMSLKDIRSLIRNKTAMFFTFLFPIVMLLMIVFIFGGMGGSDDMSGYSVSIVNMDSISVDVNGTASMDGELGNILTEVISNSNLTTYNYTEYGDADTPDSAFYDLNRGSIDGVVIIPSNFTECLTFQYVTQLPNGTLVPKPVTASIEIQVDSTEGMWSTILEQMLHGVVAAFSDIVSDIAKENLALVSPDIQQYMSSIDFLIQPVISKTTTPEITATRYRAIDFMVPGILGLVIIWGSFSHSSLTVASEREDGTLRRLITSPVSPTAMLIGSYLANLAIVFMGATVGLLTGVIVFNVQLNWDVLSIAILTIAISLTSVGAGLIISSLAKNAEAASGIQTVIVIPLQFFIGAFIPLSMLPGPARSFALALPFTQYSIATQDIMVRGLGILDVADSL
ncbi:MAG: ABC transporter permease, partial [Candidatus Thorarchaeota archaeon]